MYERGIGASDVRFVLEHGKIVEEYPDDSLFPSCLMLGWPGGRAIHVVAALDSLESQAIVITVYEPDLGRWEPDRERRRR